MSTAVLITQCLQNDFVLPVGIHDQLPNALHIGHNESKRLLGEYPEEGMLLRFIQWAYQQTESDLTIINIRDWHNQNNPKQKGHLQQFGLHCLQNTEGAKLVFEKIRNNNRDVLINSTGLNDFIETSLQHELDRFATKTVKIGIIGVWTEAKVMFLAYELTTKYPEFEIAICSALTASSSTHMHFVALEHMKKILGVNIIQSVGEFARFLTGKTIDFGTTTEITHTNQINILSTDVFQKSNEDEKIINYLFRNSTELEIKVLDGGFSGNLVLKIKSKDIHGHEEVASVVKIGTRNPISNERDSFEKIRDILGNNAPNIVDYIEFKDRAGIKYRYASMFDEKVITLQSFYSQSENTAEIYNFLDVVFTKQLGRFYKAATLEEVDLFKYYGFSTSFSDSVIRKTKELIGDFDYTDNFLELEGYKLFNICKFYSDVLKDMESRVTHSHYMSYVHGDLNGANIIIDAQKNVWLIDFFHTHRGHVLKDLIKFENDVTYIFMKISSKEEFYEACKLIDFKLKVSDLSSELPDAVFNHYELNKAYKTIQKTRTYYKDLINLDKNPNQLFIGLLRYSVHTLSFDECNGWQKKLALYTSCKLAEILKDYITLNKLLKIDILKNNPEIGMTILPGRKDWKRNLSSDVDEIIKQKFTNVISLVTRDELNTYGVTDLFEVYKNKNINFKHISIMDQGIPTVQEMKNIVNHINSCILRNEKVLIHCVGGLGRTGLVVAAYLKSIKKITTSDAVNIVRDSRSPRAIESEIQMSFLEHYN